MKIIIIVSSVLMLIAGCSKQEDTSNHSDSEASSSEIYGYEPPKFSNDSYNFPEISNDDFYEGIVVINNEESYKKLRFEDFETGTKIVGAGAIHSLQKQDDGEDTAIISTKTIVNLNAGLYEMLGSKTNFNGNLALLVFDKSKKTRVLNNDNITFKGILAPFNLYTYTNAENKVENIPIIYVHYYQAGDLTTPMINKFLENPKKDETKNDAVKPKVDADTVGETLPKVKNEVVKEKTVDKKISEQPKVKEAILVDSNGVRWSRPPKLSVTSADLEDEPRSVIVLIETDEQGKVTNVSITKSSGLSALDEKVIRATKLAKFKPYIENGEYYPIRAEIPFDLSP